MVSERCSHCGVELAGPYCARCGQRVRSGRLATPRLVREGAAEFFDLETGLLRTVRDLVLDPAGPVCGYWEGHTRPWVHPAKFYLLTFALAQFVAWQTGAFTEVAQGYLDAGPAGGAEAEPIVGFLSEYLVLLMAGGLILPVALAALVTARTLAEYAVFGFFISGQVALLGSAVLALRFPFPAFPAGEILALLVPVYLARAIRAVFRPGLGRTVLATVATLVGTYVGVTFLTGVIAGFAGL